jgi:CheY-like chemotaxis protein
MVQQERDPTAAGMHLDELVEGIWEESTRLETVLVVHGYDSLREALARTLQHYGYRASEAASREQALRVVRGDRPDLILLDLALGDNDGLALASELASRPESRGIPVLALTSDVLPPEALRLYGLREALVMPIEQRDLLASLDRALESARRRATGNLRLEPADEQCRLPLEDRLRSEHLSLFFRFPTSTRIELLPGTEIRIRSLSARLNELGVRPEVHVEGADLLLRYDLTIADALSLDSPDPTEDLFASLCESYPELATRPEALRRRIAELEAEYRRLQRLAS